MKQILTYFFLLCISLAQAQFGNRIIIEEDILTPRYISSGDLNSDGFTDIIVSYSHKFVWFENLAGSGDFSSENVINTGHGQSFSNAVADLDGDGDLDLLFTSFDDSLVYWYENLDGLASFSSPRLIDNTLYAADDVSAFDLDGDGDLDVLVTSDYDDTVSWFENLDGEGDFGEVNVIIQGTNTGRFSRAADLDNDGDLDVVTVSTGNPNVLWFRNLDGQGEFGPPISISTMETNVHSVALGDIDNDGDIDVVSAKNASGKIEVFVNDGIGNFNLESTVIYGVDGIRNVKIADLDNDNDLDILYAANEANLFAWHENLDGEGNFGPQTVIDEGGMFHRQAIPVDLDNDGDKDVVGIIQNNNILVYYENLMILGVPELDISQLKITPNPTNKNVDISSPYPIEQLQVYDMQGKLLIDKKEHVTTLNLSGIASGVLFVEIKIEGRTFIKKVIKK
ncbi:hypothetical protein SCB49_06007 [unidentified eubacterium SCB49]|nr:hypothetical protein SCB49_06007 [unidentified eubacterium SCB49]